MNEYTFKCALLLNNNIWIDAENFNSFNCWVWELGTFEVPRYPINNVIIRQSESCKKR